MMITIEKDIFNIMLYNCLVKFIFIDSLILITFKSVSA